MSISIRLKDGEEQNIPIDYNQLSDIFKGDEIINLNISLKTFKKMREFGDHYLALDKKEKKSYEMPDQLDEDWMNDYFDMTIKELIEMSNEINTLNIKILTDLFCYKISEFIKDKSVDEIRSILGVNNDFTPEEEKKLDDETEWINN